MDNKLQKFLKPSFAVTLNIKNRLLKWKRLGITLLIFGAIFAFAIGPICIASGIMEYQEAIHLNNGLITPQANNSTTFNVFLGSNEGIYDQNALSQGIDLNKIVDVSNGNNSITYPVQIAFDQNGKLTVSAKITNAEGETVAEIANNNWQSFSSSYDRNYNNYAFEATEDIGNSTNPEVIPILQIVVVGQNVFIGCYINSSFGQVFVTPIGIFPNPTQEQISKIKTETIFKYPSSKYPSQLKETSFTLPEDKYNYQTNSWDNQTLTIGYPQGGPIIDSYVTIFIGSCFATFGGIMIYFGEEKRKAVKPRAHVIIQTTEKNRKKQIGQGNPYYRKTGKRKDKRK